MPTTDLAGLCSLLWSPHISCPWASRALNPCLNDSISVSSCSMLLWGHSPFWSLPWPTSWLSGLSWTCLAPMDLWSQGCVWPYSLPWQRQHLKNLSRKETTIYGKWEEYSLTSQMYLQRYFLLIGGPTLWSLTYTLKVSPVCKDRVHNQNQHNQLNQFRRAMRKVIRQCFNCYFFNMLYNWSPQCPSHLLCTCNHMHSGAVLSTRLHAEGLLSWSS